MNLKVAAASAFLIVIMPILTMATPKSAYIWIRLDDGLYYTTYSFAIGEEGRSAVHAFLIDPEKFSLNVTIAEDEKMGGTARELAEKENALVAINGGFFTPQHTSIGLIVKDGKAVQKLHKTSWWSTFAVRDNKAGIYPPNEMRGITGVQMALQAGPRLVTRGKIPKLKAGEAARSAIGITKDGKVVLAITAGLGITMNELAKRLSASRYDGGLECPDAMALDGGSSSQLYAHIGNFELDLTGMTRITNAITVLPK